MLLMGKPSDNSGGSDSAMQDFLWENRLRPWVVLHIAVGVGGGARFDYTLRNFMCFRKKYKMVEIRQKSDPKSSYPMLVYYSTCNLF